MSRNKICAGTKDFLTRPEFSVVAIFAVMLIITAILQDNFFEHKSIARNINAFSPLILMTMGQSAVLIAGGLDLSAGALLSLQTCILTYVMKTDSPVTGFYALAAAFAAAVAIGVINGFGVGYLRIPSVILTFATSFVCLGAALFIRPTPGGECAAWFKVFYSFASVNGAPSWFRRLDEYVPPVFFLVLIACALWFVISRTKTGRYLYAVGSNRDNAYASGINTAKIQIIAYVINSIMVFLTGVYFAAQNQSGDARMGDPMTLRAIASAVVGGVALSGGRGNIYFSLLGALTLSLVNKVIFFADIPNAYQTLASGLIVILAISSSVIYSYAGKRIMMRTEN